MELRSCVERTLDGRRTRVGTIVHATHVAHAHGFARKTMHLQVRLNSCDSFLGHLAKEQIGRQALVVLCEVEIVGHLFHSDILFGSFRIQRVAFRGCSNSDKLHQGGAPALAECTCHPHDT